MLLHISNIIVSNLMYEICWESMGDRKFSERDYSTNLQLSSTWKWELIGDLYMER